MDRPACDNPLGMVGRPRRGLVVYPAQNLVLPPTLVQLYLQSQAMIQHIILFTSTQ